jgi:hypothetical protein
MEGYSDTSNKKSSANWRPPLAQIKFQGRFSIMLALKEWMITERETRLSDDERILTDELQ